MKKNITQKTVMVALIAAAMVFSLLGCGKKGPPLPPIDKGNQIASPSNVNYEVTGDTIILTWKHSIDEQRAKIEPDSFDVFLAKKTFEDCEGCPFKFELTATVPMPDMTFSMTMEKGYRYYFRLQAKNEDNLRSEYSKTVQYDHK